MRRLNPGAHVCAIYQTDTELIEVASEFLAEGLAHDERCWYLPAGDDPAALRAALDARGVDTSRAIERGALEILPGDAIYGVSGTFEPEETMAAFSGAIEQALTDGHTGFRAAANMSWALDLADGVEKLITYEALLRSLFSTARATGLCLYDGARMPLPVIDGALSTHPIVRAGDGYSGNNFYDPGVRSLHGADGEAVAAKLTQLRIRRA